MRYALRWWETLGKSERIVAMSLATGSVVAITNSTVWAVAVSYIARQKARVAIAGYAARDDQFAESLPMRSAEAENGHRGARASSSSLTTAASTR